MRREARAIALAASWIVSLVLGYVSWPVISDLEIDKFHPWAWFVTLFVVNWIGINLILTTFLFRGLPDFVLEKESAGRG